MFAEVEDLLNSNFLLFNAQELEMVCRFVSDPPEAAALE